MGRERREGVERENKDLAHVIMEAKGSQDLQCASWTPRRAVGVLPVQGQKPESQRADGVNSNPSPETEGWCPSSNTGSENEFSAFLCYSSLQQNGWGIHIGRAICSTGLPVHMLISSRNTLGGTLWVIANQISEHLAVQSHWHIKLTIIRIKLPASIFAPRKVGNTVKS